MNRQYIAGQAKLDLYGNKIMDLLRELPIEVQATSYQQAMDLAKEDADTLSKLSKHFTIMARACVYWRHVKEGKIRVANVMFAFFTGAL